LIQVVIFIILARLLTPEDFGLIAMLMIFFAISQSFIDSGMGQALIRKKTITDEDRSTVFWFNMFLSLAFYGILYVSAPAISRFFERPELIGLTRVMGLAVIFFGLAIVQRSEMTQQLEFKKQAYAQIPAMLIAGMVSVSMAYLGYGVWALPHNICLLAFCSSLALWIVQPARIRLRFYKENFNELFGFGYKLLLSGILNTSYQHIYKLVIGKFFPAATLGYFAQAKQMQQLASQNLVSIIQKVTYPLLSKAGEDPIRLKRGYRQVIQSSSFVIFPAMLLLIILAYPIMEFVLGEKWLPAAPFLQLLGITGMLYHLHAINLNILKVKGRSDLFLKLEIIKKINITIAIVIGIQFGIYGLLWGQVVSSFVALFINTYYSARFLDYTIVEQGKDVLEVLILSLPMSLVLLGILMVLTVNGVLTLIVLTLIGVFVYIVTNLLFRTETMTTVLKLLSPALPMRFKTLLHL
jgi:O-antigen/teichoic acid export membrane protein